jgi:hypothetical protein
MNTDTGELHEITETLKETLGVKFTELTQAEHDAVKGIKQSLRPIELAWVRYKRNMEPSETSIRSAFEEGFKAKEKWLDKE